jgi:chromosome segregation protein
MYLKSLELTGFKSFAEGKIEFPPGMTAIVGPNGSGKSNVVDAILWVLGEQSTKTLRSERMEDVIFNGTEARKPLGMAEVSLTLSGVDPQRLAGLPGLPEGIGQFHELMLTRRLYRNGDSEYLLNKTACRLKDIRSLLLDSRAGTKGHTVIEQGRLEQILNASPQERRELIEETAGIVRYKKQKAEALRKLESTQQNLLRVRDIIAELRSRRSALERQAKQARTFRELQAEARQIEVRLLAGEYRGLVEAQATVERELGRLELAESEHLAGQARLVQELEGLRFSLTEGQQALERVREDLAAVERDRSQALSTVEVERNRLELFERQRGTAVDEAARLAGEREQAAGAVAALRERVAEAERTIAVREARLAELERETEALAARRAEADREVERLRAATMEIAVQAANGESRLQALEGRRQETIRRAERLAAEAAEAEAQRAGLDAKREELRRRRAATQEALRALIEQRDAAARAIAAAEARAREAEQRVARHQAELAALESRVKVLQAVLREEMGYGREGEEPATSLRTACPGVREALGEWLVVPPGLERAVEALLGERVRAWLVDEPAQARPAVEFLRSRALGRGTFVPARPRGPAGVSPAAPPWWPALRGTAGVVGHARELLRGPAELDALLSWLFGGIVIVESLDAAFGCLERAEWAGPGGPTFVTLEGEVVDAAGVVSGGAAGVTGGLLQRRREVEQLEAQREAVSRALAEQVALRAESAAGREAAQALLKRLDAEVRDLEMRDMSEGKDEQGLADGLMRLGRQLETVGVERRRCEEEARGLEAEIEAGRAQQALAVREKEVREAAFARWNETRAAVEREERAAAERTTEARLDLMGLRKERDHAKGDLVRLTAEQAERQARIEALQGQVTALDEAIRRSRAERERNEALCRECGERAEATRARLLSAQEALESERRQERRVEEALAAVQRALAEAREARTAVEVRRAEIRTQLTTLEGTLAGTYQLTVEAALAQVPPEERNLDLPLKGEDLGGGPEAAPSPVVVLKERLTKIRERLDRLGNINLAAIEEHEELEQRYAFLTDQEQDLSNSIASLKEIIAKINRTTKQLFLETFNELQAKFGEVFGRFFPGGRAELVLVEPEAGPDGEPPKSEEPGVDIVAQPPGKRLKSITMLSGGEKTLTAMALIFASFLIRPSPFCILDEIDAPLDEENIGRFVSVLRELAEGVQFLLITHNKRTMAVADSLFGVTMEEPGVSKLVSVRLADLQPA